jgi:two-component system, OmpR family, sensor histidine kinase KdpD
VHDVRSGASKRGWLLSASLLVAGLTALGLAVPGFGTANLALLFLLPVVAAASGVGRRAGIGFALIAGAAFNFVALEPRLTFHIARASDLVTLAVYALVALLTASVAARLAEAGEAARAEAQSSAALSGLAQRLLTLNDRASVLAAAGKAMGEAIDAPCTLAESVEELQIAGTADDAAARWALAHRDVAGKGSPTLAAASAFYAASRAGHRGLIVRLSGDAPDGKALALLRTMIDDTADTLDRLDLSQREAEDRQRAEADAMREALFASIGHDLRTPLASLRAGIETLDGADPSQLEPVRRDALRLEQLLFSLLELARLQSTTEPPAVEAIDLTDTIAAAVDAMPAPVRNRVQIDIMPNTPLVASNAVMLHHITMNLIDNAAKYSPQGSAIEVCAAANDSGGAVLSVVDCGAGLGDDAQDLFGLFRRGKNADSAPGSGVGLAVVDAFARAIGHDVTVSNRLDGSGSVFAVAIPGFPRA